MAIADARRCRSKRGGMGVIDDFDRLSKDVQEYLKRRMDGVKMTVVEELSVMIGNVFASIMLFFILFTAFLFILVGIVAALSNVVGFELAMVAAGVMLLVVAVVIYALRVKLITNGIVRHLCRMLSIKNDDDEK